MCSFRSGLRADISLTLSSLCTVGLNACSFAQIRILLLFQTDSDEDVIFVSEKSSSKFTDITSNEAKLRALQRDIDQESLPKKPIKTLNSQRSAAAEKVKMKTEEEITLENVTKKKKKEKNKKEKDVLPKNINCDSERSTEVTKVKKKSKNAETVMEEESLDRCDDTEEKKKKKKRKLVNESLFLSSASDVTDGGSKKKKKKQVPDEKNEMDAAEDIVTGEVEKIPRKEKKLKYKSVQMKQEHVKTEEEEDKKDRAQKKAKKERNNILVEEENEEQVKCKKKKSESTVAVDYSSVSKQKRKVSENGVKLETQEEAEVGEKLKPKKKKKVKCEEDGSETPNIEGSKKRSKASLEEKVEEDKLLNKDCNSKKKLKKNQKKEKEGTASVEETSKKSKEEENEPLLKKIKEVVEDGQCGETQTSKKRKKKKSSAQVEREDDDIKAESGLKKRRKKIKEDKVEDPLESPQLDVVFLSEKSGNADEVTINQERRQALQMEVDKASQPEKTAKPSGLGQWSTAQFDSSEQQQKFLRLMGGFKKGFQPTAGSTGGANMAMGKTAQHQLQQGLMGEFERAQSRRLDFTNRGAGLGFAAPSNKKLSIDINARRSVCFDD